MAYLSSPSVNTDATEPAGVAALAALLQLQSEGAVVASERVVILVTGSGLKDIDSALTGVTMPEAIPASLEAVKSRVGA